MPGYVHQIVPGKTPEFDGWVFRRQLRATTLCIPGHDMAKLVLMYCQPDDSRADVYERTLPAYALIPTSSEEFDTYVQEFKPANYAASIVAYQEHLASIGDDTTGTYGLLIHHTNFVALDQAMPAPRPQ